MDVTRMQKPHCPARAVPPPAFSTLVKRSQPQANSAAPGVGLEECAVPVVNAPSIDPEAHPE